MPVRLSVSARNVCGICLLAAACGGPRPPAAAPIAAPPATAQQEAARAADLARGSGAHEVSENAHVLLDLIGGRMSGQPSGDRAQAYVHERLTAYGLENARLEPFPLLGWERGDASFVIDSPEALRGRRLTVLSLGHVDSAAVSAPIADAGFGTAEEIAALAGGVAGRIVLVRVGQPDGYGRSVHRTEKLSLTADAGAVGFVMVAPEPGTLVQVGVATLGDEAAPIPAVAADYETGSWLSRILAASGELLTATLSTSNWMGPAEAANVLGDIRGQSDELVLAGAHLDSWDLGTGALDNGSGTLAVLEAARLLGEHVHRTGERPLRGVRFAFWMGEELGLYGSRHHVAAALEQGVLERYRAIVNLDMVGAPTGFGAMGRPEAASLVRPLAHELRSRGFVLDTLLATGGGLYSDHQPFLLEGVPVLSLQSRLEAGAARYYHSAADTRDKIDEPALADAGAVLAALLWHLATLPELPLERWTAEEVGRRLDCMGLREPLERAGEWRWE